MSDVVAFLFYQSRAAHPQIIANALDALGLRDAELTILCGTRYSAPFNAAVRDLVAARPGYRLHRQLVRAPQRFTLAIGIYDVPFVFPDHRDHRSAYAAFTVAPNGTQVHLFGTDYLPYFVRQAQGSLRRALAQGGAL